MKAAHKDLRFNMVATGIITCAVTICAATNLFPRGITVSSAADMAQALTPVLGTYAFVLFALGLWAAGFSSAVYMTSCIPPMMQEAFGFEDNPKSFSSRLCYFDYCGFSNYSYFCNGRYCADGDYCGCSSVEYFHFAFKRYFNSILANRRKILGECASSVRQNIAMAVVAIVVILLTYTSIPTIIGLFLKISRVLF